MILLSGEAGIGKFRLVQVLKEHVARADHTCLEGRSSPYYHNTALYPITELLHRALVGSSKHTPEEGRDKLEQTLGQYRLPVDDMMPLFAPLLSLLLPAEQYPPRQLTPQQQRQKTLEAIVALLIALSEHQPVLLILEDLHWSDPSTLELLTLLMDQIPTAPLLALLTCRPEFEPPWRLRTYLTPMTLTRFTRAQIETMVERVADGKRLPAEVMQHLVEKTDGVPLYVEAMTKVLLGSGVFEEAGGQYTLRAPLTSLAFLCRSRMP